MTTPDGPFRELVKAEMRATWSGELRWLWRVLALILIPTILFMPTDDLGLLEVYLVPVWLYLTMTPLVLGSDLLSIAFPGNPEPHRAWPFAAILARAVGRLLPWMAVSTAMYLAWMVRFTAGLGLGHSPADGSAQGDFLGTVAMTLLMPAETLLLFTLGAVVSSALRRPKRLLVTGLIQATLVGSAFGLAAWPAGISEIPRNVAVGLSLHPLHYLLARFYNLARGWLGVPEQMGVRTPGLVHLLYPILTLAVALTLWVWIRYVVESRLRQHPCTVEESGLRVETTP
jgi:hypothetical protein